MSNSVNFPQTSSYNPSTRPSTTTSMITAPIRLGGSLSVPSHQNTKNPVPQRNNPIPARPTTSSVNTHPTVIVSARPKTSSIIPRPTTSSTFKSLLYYIFFFLFIRFIYFVDKFCI
jgi:hypothetical protein